jgi:pimeloyl-ACP methyl ester carboxylesterase
MRVGPRRWKRLAVRILEHAASVLPPDSSAWAVAMVREADHIENDFEVVLWACGCLAAAYRQRLSAAWTLNARRGLGRCIACTAVMCVLCLGALNSAIGKTAPVPPVFERTACNLPTPAPDVASRIECGTVAVPRNYDQPGSGVFKLAVVVVRSAQQPALPDPVVYISGGPGAPLTKYADYQARHPYARDRDLILVDQRGVGHSEPNLCPDVAGGLLGASFAVADSITAKTKDRRHALFMACRDAAKAQGIDLDDFGTSVTVEDFEQVRRALGIARWDVVGNSYGTTVAMTLMARHPEAIRSAVLDSVYPPDLVLPPWSARIAAARTAFFGMCQQDPACAAAFPDLAGQYRQTLERLSHTPMTVSVPAAMHQPDNQAPLTASLFEMVVTLRLYYSENHPDLPRLIATVHDGKVEDFAKALAAVLAGAADISDPAHIAVECRDRPHLREPAQAGADALDQIVDHGICTDWSELGPAPVIPAGTNIPTLVLAGQFDPNASLPLSRHVAELIGERARWVEFPLMGHNVRHMSPCAASIVAAFIDQPGQVLDTSCAQQVKPIRFLPR